MAYVIQVEKRNRSFLDFNGFPLFKPSKISSINDENVLAFVGIPVF